MATHRPPWLLHDGRARNPDTCLRQRLPPRRERLRGLAGTSHVTYAQAPTLPRDARFNGSRSVRDTRIATIVSQAIGQLRSPIKVDVACWDAADYSSVAAGVGAEPSSAESVVYGFWLPRAPRWINLAPDVCLGIQKLLYSLLLTSDSGAMLTVALHEAFHAHGVHNEAQTNCDALQAVPFAGRAIGLSIDASLLLGARAIARVKALAPPGYWNASLCRDDGTCTCCARRVTSAERQHVLGHRPSSKRHENTTTLE